MKKSLLSAIAVLLTAFSADAAVNIITKNFATGASASTSNPVVYFDSGAVVTAGTGFVAVGYFSIPDAQVTFENWAAAAGAFQQFGANARVGTGAGAAPGTSGLFQITPGADVGGTAFEGKNIYVVIGNGDTAAGSTQLAVFKSTATFLAEPTPSVNAFLTDTDGAGAVAGSLLVGTFEPGKVVYTTGPLANQTLTPIRLAGVPEPGSVISALVGGLLFIRRRR